MRQCEERALSAYRERFARDPVVIASAPGRVNLIGEHTDYSGGFVLPCAIERRVAVALGPGDGALYSADYDDRQPLEPESDGGGPREDDGWARYPRGIVWALRQRGYTVPPVQCAIAGDVPRGAGLSSSAAFEAATALALDAHCGFGIPRVELALICQQAENDYVGVRGGIMDQYAALLCQAGAALLIDCRGVESQLVPLDLAAAGLTLVICDTRVERTLAATGYNARHAACERAARALGVPQLRDARPGDLGRLTGDALRYARHVVTENQRVLAAVVALRRGDYTEFGRSMYASHTSLRDDFAVSTPELDAVVRGAADLGAVGARLTGAGFGGCAIALIANERVDLLQQRVREAFAAHGFRAPAFYTTQPSPGAEIVWRHGRSRVR